jgi:mRNA interferase RelE/StbE
MAEYTVVMRPRAAKQLAKIAEPFRTKLATAIRDLAFDPRPAGHKKLAGEELYRIRAGDYRAIYAISDAIVTVTVTKAAHRREAYRR